MNTQTCLTCGRDLEQLEAVTCTACDSAGYTGRFDTPPPKASPNPCVCGTLLDCRACLEIALEGIGIGTDEPVDSGAAIDLLNRLYAEIVDERKEIWARDGEPLE